MSEDLMLGAVHDDTNDSPADMDFLGRSLKAQLKQANRQKARFALLLGEEECASQRVQLKDLETGDQRLVSAQEAIDAIKEEMGE